MLRDTFMKSRFYCQQPANLTCRLMDVIVEHKIQKPAVKEWIFPLAKNMIYVFAYIKRALVSFLVNSSLKKFEMVSVAGIKRGEIYV